MFASTTQVGLIQALALMPESSRIPTRQPLLARIAAALITIVVSGLGALHFFSAYAPGRWTRFGYAGPLFGQAAQKFGLAMFLVGLIPLAFFARSARQAGWISGVIAILFLAVLFTPGASR